MSDDSHNSGQDNSGQDNPVQDNPVQDNPVGQDTMSKALLDAVNYHQWLFDLTKPYLGEFVLEFGTGRGVMTNYVAGTKSKIYSADINHDSVYNYDGLIKKGVELDIFDFIKSDFYEYYSGKNIDTIINFNVLEHIEDDEKLIKDMSDLLIKNGKLLLFVPAFQLLYGNMDKQAGHYKRYRRDELVKLFSKYSLRVISSDYINPIGFFGWYYTNKIKKVDDLNSNEVNSNIAIFDKYILKYSRMLQPITRRFFGQSLFLVGEKK